MIFNLASVVYWRVVIARKQRQLYIDNVQEKGIQVMYYYAIGNLVNVETTGIYRKLDYNKQGPYRIKQVKKSTV